MEREREVLLRRIRLALAGDDVGDDLAASLPNPGTLDRLEKAAWIALHSWRDDAEIRSANSLWEHFGRQRLEDLSASLVTAPAD